MHTIPRIQAADFARGTPCARATLVATALLALLAAPHADAAGSAGCRVLTGDFCVCCPPSDCRREASFYPGGTAGLLLKARRAGCAVNPYHAARCRSGGVVASERKSALGVWLAGERARIDPSRAQLDELAGQLEELGR